jgi:hypothetical protein
VAVRLFSRWRSTEEGNQLRRWILLLLLVSASWAQTTVTLNGTSYALKDHPRVWFDGPGGSITSSFCTDTLNPACKGVASNLPWTANNNEVAPYITSTSDCPSGPNCSYNWAHAYSGMRISNFMPVASAALGWYTDHSKTTYLDLVKYWIGNVDLIIETLGCDETFSNCGNNVDNDYARRYLQPIFMAYELVQDQLDPTVKAAFVGMILNDRQDAGGCTNAFIAGSGTITTTTSSTTVTGIGTLWLTNPDTTQQLAPGDTIYILNDPHRVTAVSSDTSLTYLTQNMGYFTAHSSVAYKIAHRWQSGNCGFIDYIKHNLFSQFSTPPILSSSPYGVSGGASGWHPNDLLHNQVATTGVVLTAAALSLADADSRAITLLQQIFAWWNYPTDSGYTYTNQSSYPDGGYHIFKQYWSGFAQVDTRYFMSRVHGFMQDQAWFWDNNFTTTIGSGYLQGAWLKNSMLAYIYSQRGPTNSSDTLNNLMPFQDRYTTSQLRGDNVLGVMTGIHAYQGSNEAAWANYWLRNLSTTWALTGSVPGLTDVGAAQWAYIFLSPTDAATNPTTVLPLDRAFTGNDFDGPTGVGTNVVLSRSGWNPSSDTILLIQAFGARSSSEFGRNDGSYKIFRKRFLVAEDNVNGGYSRSDSGSANHTNYMEIGGTDNLIDPNPGNGRPYVDIRVPRYHQSTAGNSYMYSLVDGTAAYMPAAGVIRQQRQFVHFKAADTQELIVIYDDVKTAKGALKRSFTHFNILAADGNTAVFDQTSSSMAVTNATSSLQTMWVFPSATRLYIDNADGSYTGGDNTTFRVSACATADGNSCDPDNKAWDLITIHVPGGPNVSALPRATLLAACDANFRGVQIEGVDPKVTVFAQGGNLYARAVFTTTFSGNGQILITGLQPGSYAVTKDGAPVAVMAVSAADGTLSFQSTSGAFSILRKRPKLFSR